jgi:energy-coupling factor transporter transmembrane protein EcfT
LKKALIIFIWILVFILLSIVSQIGGIVFIVSILVAKLWKLKFRAKALVVFIILYLISTFIIVPITAPLFGREKVIHSENIKPATFLTVILNRNYVQPEMNSLLSNTASILSDTPIRLIYLDANFPFINRFPLLPHLSHNDGRKIDLCLVYEDSDGNIMSKPKSRTGYGFFAESENGETNQNNRCKEQGFFQYDFPKYLSFGEINQDLHFSRKGTKQLISVLLQNMELEKIFIEPHLKSRMGLTDSRIRYQGCHSVRHDDHIHIQVK